MLTIVFRAIEDEDEGPRMVLLHYSRKARKKWLYRASNNQRLLASSKRLVFHTNNQPTNWVIHEYHLVDDNDGHSLEVFIIYSL